MRTDNNRNPTAFTTDIAKEAGLVRGVDFEVGDPFPPPSSLYTAKLVGDPIAVTIRVIDAIGFRTKHNVQRWEYISLPKFVWAKMTPEEKRDVIGWMYENEGGTEMRGLFPRLGAL